MCVFGAGAVFCFVLVFLFLIFKGVDRPRSHGWCADGFAVCSREAFDSDEDEDVRPVRSPATCF